MSQRLETFGSAFRDPAKGPLDEALSQRQTQIVRVLDKKTRPKSKAQDKPRKPMNSGSGFKRKMPERKGRVRDINEDIEPEDREAAVRPSDGVAPSFKPAPDKAQSAQGPLQRRAGLKLIKGGRNGD